MEATLELIKLLKQRILSSRYLVAKIANAESLRLYYSIGEMIEYEFGKNNWGAKVINEISARLQQEVPGLRGFSGKNIEKMRTFYNAWKTCFPICSSLTSKLDSKAIQQILPTVSDKFSSHNTDDFNYLDKDTTINSFFSTSFTHHYEIIIKTSNEIDRWYYIQQAAQQFWTVRHLRTELLNKSHLNQLNQSNNFNKTLSEHISNKAIRAFKDQYLLDYVNLEDADDDIDERVLEREIVLNIKKFLMSLGSDFSFMGNQYRIMVGDDEYFIDLLFFHRGLQSLVAFELKRGKFKPEYIGKMNFYLSALDDLVRKPHENPSIGIILCKEKDQKKVEYSFRDVSKPLGVATYKTSETLPPELKNALPDAETLKKLME
jgi:predicted nuclease of restriction endonuclease-like (RecB) superfamily